MFSITEIHSLNGFLTENKLVKSSLKCSQTFDAMLWIYEVIPEKKIGL